MKKRIALATLAILPMTVSSANASGQTGVVTADTLNIRSGPSTKHSIVSYAKKNDKVTILDSSNGWYKVKLSSGKEGWASASYITKTSSNNDSSISAKKKVSVSRLNMRSGASTSYRVITVLNKGEVVEVISESNGWSKVKYDGRLGYVSSEYIENIEEESTNKTTKQVNTATLNVRSGPSTSYSVIGKVHNGNKVQVISESNGWSKIEYNGKNAYVSSMYLKAVNVSSDSNKPVEPSTPETPSKPEVSKETKIVNTEVLNVRSGPSTSYSKIGKVYKGNKVGVISESNGWSKIEFNGKEAYVSSDYLVKENNKPETPSKPETLPETKPEAPKETKVVTTDALNVRSGPGTNYSKIGKVYRGNKVGVISESNGWSKIEFNGKEAYVSSDYLGKVGQETTPPITNPDDTNQGSQGNGGSENINGSTINYKALNYTLTDHVNIQLDRASIGGNVIDSSRPRSSEVLTTFMMAQARGFVPANVADIEYFLNPSNFTKSSKGMMQFLRTDSYKGGVSVDELNAYLNSLAPASSGTNVFYNQGATFINAAQKYNIDLIYLVSHAMWETGYGKSTLAQGQTLTTYKGQALPQPVKVYNFFGIGAIDKSANVSGAEAAYSNGWTSVEATIDGSAQWIANNYIKSTKYNQNTIYKMKWNYDYSWHQYATDVNWANGISGIMNNLIKMYDTGSNLVFEVPQYK